MAKVIPAALQAHYDTGQMCLAAAILLQRLDGKLFGFGMNSQPLTLDLTPWDTLPWDLAGRTAFAFDSASGMEAISVQSSSGFDVDDASLVVLNKGEVFTEPDILAGRWRGARYRLFLYRWDVATPTIADDVETLKVGTLGEIQISPVALKIELHCLKRLLQEPVGIVSQPTCRVRFGSQGVGKCNVPLAAYTHNLTVTAVIDARTFSCAAATQPADAFGEGEVLFTSGGNEGIPAVVEDFAGGVFTLSAPLVLPLSAGDTLTAIEGCRKRMTEDCRDRYSNVINFQGEPHRPTRDRVVSGVAS